jgi:hypothetical protein
MLPKPIFRTPYYTVDSNVQAYHVVASAWVQLSTRFRPAVVSQRSYVPQAVVKLLIIVSLFIMARGSCLTTFFVAVDTQRNDVRE